MSQIIKILLQAPVVALQRLLLSASPVDLNVHLADLIGKAGHHRVVLADLVFQAHVDSVHIAYLIVQCSNSVFHISQLVTKLAVVSFDVSQSLELNFDIVKLAGSAEVSILGSASLQELLAELLDLVFSSVRSVSLHLSTVFSRSPLARGHVNHLLVMGSFLSGLKLQSTPLLFEFTREPVTLLSQPRSKSVLSILSSELLLGFKPLVLLLNPLLCSLLIRLITSHGFLLHSSLHFF